MKYNHSIFGNYVRYMRKAAYAYNMSHKPHLKEKRGKRYVHEYFRYAKIAIKLAHKLPVHRRISLKVFLDADKYGAGIVIP